MTRREAQRLAHQENTLMALGFTNGEAEALRRISMTLHRWYEHECNGIIQRDGENGDGRPFWYNPHTGRKTGPVPDLETGAVDRLKAVIETRNNRHPHGDAYNDLRYYLQTDPRGAVLYIIRPGDVPEGADVAGYYTRGICVY